MATSSPRSGKRSDELCDVLRVLATGGESSGPTVRPARVAGQLDDRSRVSARLGALLTASGSSSALEHLVADALDAGLSAEEIVDVLVEVAPTVGLARLVPAAIELASALGYSVDRALEDPKGDCDAEG